MRVARVGGRCAGWTWHEAASYLRVMSVASNAPKPLSRSLPVHLVLWASVLYIVVAAVQLVGAVITMSSRLAQRSAGITTSWNPGLPAPQPTDVVSAGVPYVKQGSTVYFTQAQGTVVNVPASSIVFTSAGDILGLLCGVGVAVCLIVLTRNMTKGMPFARASVQALLVLAAVVFVGFEGATLLHALGTLGLDSVALPSPSRPDGQWKPPASQTVFFELWPVYVALALLALAAVFRAGAAYQQGAVPQRRA